jgi:hypothetical protein
VEGDVIKWRPVMPQAAALGEKSSTMLYVTTELVLLPDANAMAEPPCIVPDTHTQTHTHTHTDTHRHTPSVIMPAACAAHAREHLHDHAHNPHPPRTPPPHNTPISIMRASRNWEAMWCKRR